MDAFACFSCSFFSLLCCFYCAFKPVLFSALSRLEEESSAFYSSSRLWDDGIILPQDTRKVGFPFRPFYSPVSQGVNMTHSRLAMCWFQTWGCHFSLCGIHLCNSHPVSSPLVYPKSFSWILVTWPQHFLIEPVLYFTIIWFCIWILFFSL